MQKVQTHKKKCMHKPETRSCLNSYEIIPVSDAKSANKKINVGANMQPARI